MTTATLGTCNSCGLGLNLPHRAPWHPGQRVVVMTEEELGSLLTPSSQGAKEYKVKMTWGQFLRPDSPATNSGCQNFRGPVAPWLLGVKPSSSPTQANPT